MGITNAEGIKRTFREQKKREKDWKNSYYGRVEQEEIRQSGAASYITNLHKEFHFAPTVEERFPATANFLKWGERVKKSQRRLADSLLVGGASASSLGAWLLMEGFYLPAAALLMWGIPSFVMAVNYRKKKHSN